jgi:GxxExxY protein
MILNAEFAEHAEEGLGQINLLTKQIIGAAIEVHWEKGPGLLESAYETCLAYEFALRGLSCTRQVAVPLTYKGQVIDVAFRADLIVEDKVLLELKAVESILPVHKAQVLSYIRETQHRVGLLINFHVTKLVDGVTRIINDRAHSEFSATSALKTPVHK